jgi:hypothetical protein
MEILFETAFKRFSGKSDIGVIKLTQAMGGGKTHNMLALALLAQNPDWRSKIVENDVSHLPNCFVDGWRHPQGYPIKILSPHKEGVGCLNYPIA